MNRPPGSTESGAQSREQLLDAVERLMVASGYASVTYRAVARECGVTAGLVQYYFPTLDELLTSTVRRRLDDGVRRLAEIADGERMPSLAALWRFSHGESTAALVNEFMALANHREAVRAVLAEANREVRALQMRVLARLTPADAPLGPEGLLFLINGLPKLAQMEASLGITVGHDEVELWFGSLLDRIDGDARRP